MADGKMITDINPTPTAQNNQPADDSDKVGTEQATTATIIKEHSLVPDNQVSQKDSFLDTPTDQENQDSIAPQSEQPLPDRPISKAGVDIQPPNKAASDLDIQSPLSGAQGDAKDDSKSDQKDNSTPSAKARFEASDSLPDETNKDITSATNDMQAPTIYDTTQYFVPIKDTVHSHGHTGAIIAGIVSSIAVLALVAFVAVTFF